LLKPAVFISICASAFLNINTTCPLVLYISTLVTVEVFDKCNTSLTGFGYKLMLAADNIGTETCPETVIEAVALTFEPSFAVAVTTTVPLVTAVNIPVFGSIVATALLSTLHVTVLFAAVVGVIVATSVSVPPGSL